MSFSNWNFDIVCIVYTKKATPESITNTKQIILDTFSLLFKDYQS